MGKLVGSSFRDKESKKKKSIRESVEHMVNLLLWREKGNVMFFTPNGSHLDE